MANEKVLKLARKLQALSERGIGGEKVNAENQLEKLMLKHNFCMEDLEQEERINYNKKYEDMPFCIVDMLIAIITF